MAQSSGANTPVRLPLSSSASTMNAAQEVPVAAAMSRVKYVSGR